MERGSIFMVYRPTIRYDEVFRTYVDALFHATHLDRNQIIRAALFTAAHSREFHRLIRTYQKGDVPLPFPQWSLEQNILWLQQSPTGEKDVIGDSSKAGEIIKESENTNRLVTENEKKRNIRFEQAYNSSEPIKITGGLIFTLD
jgi:hypothetical protein